jgi:hypothetical protein
VRDKSIKGRASLAPNYGALPRPGMGGGAVGKFMGGPCPHCGQERHQPVPPNPPLVLSKLYKQLVHQPCAEDARQNGVRK